MKNRTTNTQRERRSRLMPKGVPRYIRCYDNGGESWDRYTVVFTRRSITEQRPHVFMYVGMSTFPFHPQGFGQHGETSGKPCDTTKEWPPAMGRKNHLGTRIPFAALPTDCRKLVMNDYKDLWKV